MTTPSERQDFELTYDAASNVHTTKDNADNEQVTYTYDQLNRLIGASGFNGSLTAAYTYDAIGNLLTKKEGSQDLRLCYPASGSSSVRPHAVTTVFNTTGAQCGSGGTWLGIGYDADGNIASQNSEAYTFDAENRLKTRTVTGGTMSYLYDGNGALAKRTNADGSWTEYVGGVYEKRSDGSLVKYYQAYGQTLAMREVPTGVGARTITYLLHDQLGSTVERLDANGNTVAGSETKFWPYGAVRAGAAQDATDRRFTGQQQEPGSDALGLYDYGARFYSTTVGRFASVDPLVGSVYAPQSWNPYSYVRNNPVVYVDPSGLDPGCLITACSGPSDVVVDDGKCALCGALMALGGLGLDSPEKVANYGRCGSSHCPGETASAITSESIAAVCIDIDDTGCTLQKALELLLILAAWGASTSAPYVWDGAQWVGEHVWEGATEGATWTWDQTGKRAWTWFSDDEPPERTLDDPGSLVGATAEEVEELIPDEWEGPIPTTGLEPGQKWFVPGTRRSDGIRIMPGNPNARDALHQGPRVTVVRNGVPVTVPLKGNPSLP